jgi:hypothetical protein
MKKYLVRAVDDEPASVLLERIRAERETGAADKKSTARNKP